MPVQRGCLAIACCSFEHLMLEELPVCWKRGGNCYACVRERTLSSSLPRADNCPVCFVLLLPWLWFSASMASYSPDCLFDSPGWRRCLPVAHKLLSV